MNIKRTKSLKSIFIKINVSDDHNQQDLNSH